MSDRCKACGDLQSEVLAKVLFHPFPVDIEKRVLWEEKCKEGGIFDASSVSLEEEQNWAVCSRHFRSSDYLTINSDIYILKPNACPSIFRPKDLASSQNALLLTPKLANIGEQVLLLQDEGETSILPFEIPTTLQSDLYQNCDSVEVAYNWKNRCRVCGKLWSNSVLINLFGDKGPGRKLVEKINCHLPITVKPTDNLPLRACKPCVEKLNDFNNFCMLCTNADTEFRNEVKRFKRAKEMEKKITEKNERGVISDSSKIEQLSGRRSRKSNPGKRSGIGKPGPRSKKSKSDSEESSGVEDADEMDMFEDTKAEDKSLMETESNPLQIEVHMDENAGGPERIEIKIENEADDDSIRPREGTQRFNLRSAPRRNVTLPVPLYLIATNPTRQVTTPSILRPRRKSPEPENQQQNQISLPPTIYPRRTRQRGLKDRQPRSKRFFVTRRKYGDQIINQKCSSPDCTVECETVEMFLQHKYLYHDESNFSFCRVCSQVYETKPRNEDNGHRHEAVAAPLPEVAAQPKTPQNYRCEECKKDFQDKSKLNQHNRIMHGSFHCTECGKKFSALVEFKKHLQDHIFAKGGTPHKMPKRKYTDKFTCEICKAKNTNFMQLNIHTMKQHESEYKYLLCDCCNNVFYTEQLLKLHKEQQQRSDLQLCENCGGTFATIDELRMHKKACTTILALKPIACQPCNAFIHPNKMRAHLTWHITRKEPPRCQKCLLPKWTATKHNCKFYRCEACQLGFNGYPKYLAHKRTHVGKDAKYFCNVCPAGNFNVFEELVEHFQSHTADEVKDSRMKFMSTMPNCRLCPLCLECVCKNVLQKHNRYKHDVMDAPKMTEADILTCPVCNKVQPDVDKYIEHRLNHDTQLMLTCQHCPLAFDNENRRSIHVMRCHSVEKRVNCEYCGKVFNSIQKIRVHIMRHLKYKPYVCKHPGCKASYYLVGDWRKHSMLHLGINPNVCKICNKQFMKAESLVLHNKKWHAEGEEVTSATTPELPATAEVVYQCCKCEYQDRTEAAVLQHLERDHCDEVVVSCEGEMAELSTETSW